MEYVNLIPYYPEESYIFLLGCYKALNGILVYTNYRVDREATTNLTARLVKHY